MKEKSALQMEVKKRKTKGEGSIYQLTTGTWRGKVAACIETDNKIKYFSGKTRADVTKKIKEFRTTIKTGLPPQTDKYFEEYIKNWLYTVKLNQLKPASFDRVESTVNVHLIPKLGLYKLSEITPDLIQKEIIDYMQKIPTQDNETGIKCLSYSSIKKAHDILNECFNYALIRNHIYSNPILLTTMPRKDKFTEREITYLSNDEIVRFCNACESRFGNGEYRYYHGFAFVIMLYTGVRAGEMLKLRWEDVDLENKALYIKGNLVSVKDRSKNQSDDLDNGIKLPRITIEQKTAKTTSGTNREVPINKKAMNAFLELQTIYQAKFKRLPTYVVSKEVNSFITLSTFQKSFDKILARAEIEHCGLHSLRHTFASMLFAKGVDIKIVSEILGHSNVSITYNTYIHIIKEKKQLAIDLIDDI